MSVTLEMSFYTCSDCGVTYGYPAQYDRSDCPLCMKRERDRLDIRIDELYDEKEAIERTSTALKGVITKLKKRIRNES